MLRRPPRPATTDRVEIKVRENGPYRITGPVRLIDADGNEFDLEPWESRVYRLGGG